jgi:hypothetical protein
MFVKLYAALNQFAQIEAHLAGLGRPREGQEALYDLGGATRLTVGDFELPPRGLILRGIAQEFGDPQDCGQRIIQLMGDAGNHLAHRGKPFVLDQLLLHTLRIGGVSRRGDNTRDATREVHKRAGRSPEQPRFAVISPDQVLGAAIGALTGDNAVQECLEFLSAVRLDAIDE